MSLKQHGDMGCAVFFSWEAVASTQSLLNNRLRKKAYLTGSLEATNEWYAIAKIAGIQLCRALRLQHNFDAISLMPTNLYGPGDNYHPSHSHVMAALIRRFTEAARNGTMKSPAGEQVHQDVSSFT